MFRVHKKQHDILTKKRADLDSFATVFNTAVSTITNTIQMLTTANEAIAEEMDEITEYQNKLDETRADLANAKELNEKVIKNFTALIGE